MSKQRISTKEWILSGCIATVMVALLSFFFIDFRAKARKSGDNDRIRIKVRSGELPPEAGKGIMAEEEIEFLKKGKTPDGRPWWEQG